jgi:hypothetical protein
MQPVTPRTRGRPRKYSTPEERAQARLIQSREHLQRYRERQKAKKLSPLSPTDGNSGQQLATEEDNINDDQGSRSVTLFAGSSPELPSESSESDSSPGNTTSSSSTCSITFKHLRRYQPVQSPVSPIRTLRLPAGNYLISLL